MEIHVLGLSAFNAQVTAINKKKELCHLLFREDLNDGWCFWSFVFGFVYTGTWGNGRKIDLQHRYVQIGGSSINQLLFPSSWVLSVHRINTCRHFSPENYLVTMLTWNVHKTIKWPTFHPLGDYIISSLRWMKFKLLYVMVGNGSVSYHTNTTKTCIFQFYLPGLKLVVLDEFRLQNSRSEPWTFTGNTLNELLPIGSLGGGNSNIFYFHP